MIAVDVAATFLSHSKKRARDIGVAAARNVPGTILATRASIVPGMIVAWWHASIVPGMILATRHAFLFTIADEVENESQFQYARRSPRNRRHDIDIDPTDRRVITSDRQ